MDKLISKYKPLLRKARLTVFNPSLSGSLASMLLLFVLVAYMVSSTIAKSTAQPSIDAERSREAIRLALVQCYALEGSYPSDIAHLGRYGILFDFDRFIYYYDVFGSNIMPDVKILLRE